MINKEELRDENDLINHLKNKGTGSYDIDIYDIGEGNKIIEYPFDKYLIKVVLSEKNEFIGIVEVKVNQKFLDYRKRLMPKGYHDVSKFYQE